MPTFLMCRHDIGLFLFLLLGSALNNIQAAKVTDLTPRVLTRNVIPKLKNVSCNRYFRRLQNNATDIVKQCSDVPLATTLFTSSVLLSSTVWAGLVSPESLVCKHLPKSFKELHIPFTSVLLIPELNGASLLNLISFYTLIKQAEVADGTYHVLKRMSTNLVATTLISAIFRTTSDFHKFSRAVTVTNALENPEQRVNFQGIISLKQWHLPLALLIADYVMTLRAEQAIEGSKATLAGVLTHMICNRT